MIVSRGLCALAVPITALAALLSAGPLRAQCQNGQQTSGQQSGTAGQNRLLAALQRQQSALQNSLQQTTNRLTTLQQQGAAGSRATLVNALQQRQAALQSALQQNLATMAAIQQGQTGTSGVTQTQFASGIQINGGQLGGQQGQGQSQLGAGIQLRGAQQGQFGGGLGGLQQLGGFGQLRGGPGRGRR